MSAADRSDNQNMLNQSSASEARHLFQQVIDKAYDAFIAIDEQSKVTYWNAHAEQTFGWSVDEALGQPLASLIIPQAMRSAHAQGMQLFHRSGHGPILNKRIEVPAITKTGKSISVELAVFVIAPGTPYAFGAFLHDVTGRLQREAMEAAANKITRKLLFATDMDECLTDICALAGQTAGFDFASLWLESADRSKLECHHFWCRSETEAPLAEVTKGRSFKQNEGFPGLVWSSGNPMVSADITAEELYIRSEHAHKSGLKAAILIPLMAEEKPLGILELLRASPVEQDEGLINLLMSTGNQIAQFIKRTHSERALLIAQEEALTSLMVAEQALFAKSNLLATVSHELRTPMGGIIGLTELISLQDLGEENNETVTAIFSSAKNLLQLLNDVLDTSKLDEGKLTLTFAQFSLHHLLAEISQLLAPEATKKNLRLEFYCDPNIPNQLWGDEQRVRQVLLNLATNALKFSLKGEVHVSAKVLSEDQDTLTVLTEISDSGIGIPSEHLETIFEPYAQVHDFTTRMYGGTGLGLSISKNLVELMSGKIGVRSNIDEGSTFWFSLPLSKRSPQNQ